ncbi:unnamed protein product [Blepharisma stoltei]|uniref:EF-hand domain-containing protein n=1 Tax=Blepharisma stoltei TaxID=1481888 RepID=A0AAU9IQA0_9CILI|nr:unnamed protein product [Blepharisma stoltei]
MGEEPVLDFSHFHINPNDVQEAMKSFRWFHSRRTGLLKREDVPKAYESLGLKLSQQEINAMIDKIKKPGEGEEARPDLSLPEYLNITLQKIHQMNMQDDLMALFHLYDLDRKGFLSREEIQFLALKLLSDLGLNSDLVNKLVDRSDRNSEGLVDYKTFVILLVQEL